MNSKTWIGISVIMAVSVVLFLVLASILKTQEPLRDILLSFVAVCLIFQTAIQIHSNPKR
jgi:hypothetical protein